MPPPPASYPPSFKTIWTVLCQSPSQQWHHYGDYEREAQARCALREVMETDSALRAEYGMLRVPPDHVWTQAAVDAALQHFLKSRGMRR